LTKENRELKKELDGLRSLSDRNPLIKLKFNDGRDVSLDLTPIDYSSVMSIPSKIENGDIPGYLDKYINQDDIDRYNENLPNEVERVKKYNKELILYESVKSRGVEFNLGISNIGSSMAKNIFVDIEFPKSVEVLREKKEDFTKPAVPALRKTPIEKAESLYQKSLGQIASVLDAYDGFSLFSGAIGSLDDSPVFTALPTHLVSAQQERYVTTKGNTVTIHSNDLLHTKMWMCKDAFILLPYDVGEYEIKVTIMCEEYIKPEKYTFPLVIN
jgi:hypothetical protein